MKTCNVCNETKPTTEFYREAKMPDGFRKCCKACKNKQVEQWRDNNRPKYNKMAADWRKANPEKVRESDRKRRYNVTPEEYKAMWDKQGGKCPISEDTLTPHLSRTVHTDHDHVTGEFRGILCQNCNNGLGHFKDNTKFLENAINYLNKGK